MTEAVHTPPRMRGIKEAMEEIKAADPKTALTEYALRRLVLSGGLPSVRLGIKYLVNMDVLTEYLYSGTPRSGELTAPGGIRKIAE